MTNRGISRFSRLRFVAFLLITAWYIADRPQIVTAQYAPLPPCISTCNNTVDCATPCNESAQSAITCGDWNGGLDQQWCAGYGIGWCGDGTCSEDTGEDCQVCNADCGNCPDLPDVRYPPYGPNWASVTSPDDNYLSDTCEGNCGGGCNDSPNPCGGPAQYWQLDFVDGPVFGTFYDDWCY